MKRLLIKKLIVISDVEESSREISLLDGLNLIIGENKTGKSSLIKSMFYSLGCELVFEDDWKNLVQKYILFFDYGEKKYCVIREKKRLKLFNIVNDSQFVVLSETDHFHEFCAVLMREFDISMDCLTNHGGEITATTPLLFRFQYIDQDLGWSKIGESFTNMKYIRNWKENTNKYVVGYQGEEYYKEKQNILKIKNTIQEFNVKLKYFSELLKAIQTKTNVEENIQDDGNTLDNSQIKSVFSELDNLERRKIKLGDNISEFKNVQYEKNLQLATLKMYIKELNKDHDYAMKQEDDIICPTCGTVHNNTLLDRLEIVKDVQSGNELIKQIRIELKELESQINELSEEKIQINKRYNLLKKQIERSKESATIANTFRNEGKQEIVLTGKFQRDKIIKSIVDEERNIKLIEENIKELNSSERRKKIISNFKAIYEKILHELNVPLKALKLKDFVQELTKTGSEKPRIIYAYHVALYLYNLNRIVSPFNLLVIDTPNQQGQDWKNLKSIDEILGHLLDKRGQVIIGTERETGYEKQASNVIRLLEERKTLTKKDYISHIELYRSLEQLSKLESAPQP
ncbi:hypothetical protein [Paenibacillus xerothermodurans]|uniref:Rad50/SbcC-type AAA domain-containing protein n=1 Tax=Paenibacillus xerothermodurans TaxID=1977292 RepID=A0A2W1NLJ7_PAEXE|nr:hypothetical protein [Paenibacillus xerothermodurans]PZE20305.1 hypothetical protein CBW46_014245 [Paenibacillus xerothermodurans]